MSGQGQKPPWGHVGSMSGLPESGRSGALLDHLVGGSAASKRNHISPNQNTVAIGV